MAGIIDITDARFEEEVMAAPGPVLVDFWAPWCGPCRAMNPILEDIAARRGDALKIVKVNADQNPVTMERFGVRGIPALFLIRDGLVAGSLNGAQTPAAVEQWLEESLARPAAQTVTIARQRAAEAAAREKPDETPEDGRRFRIRPFYLLWTAAQGGAGVLLMGAAAASPAAWTLGAGMVAYSLVRAAESFVRRPPMPGKQQLIARLQENAKQRVLWPHYARLAYSAAGNGVVLAGGAALFAMTGGGSAALGGLMVLKGAAGLAVRAAGAALLSRLPAAVAVEHQRAEDEQRPFDRNQITRQVLTVKGPARNRDAGLDGVKSKADFDKAATAQETAQKGPAGKAPPPAPPAP